MADVLPAGDREPDDRGYAASVRGSGPAERAQRLASLAFVGSAELEILLEIRDGAAAVVIAADPFLHLPIVAL